VSGHPTAARRLARFVVGLTLEDLPAPVAAKAMELALDTLGNCLAASREDFGPANAVLANATLAHGLDFDDTPIEERP
jgi:hypothetical protein